MLNRDALARGMIPCETQPVSGALAQLSDRFHARAVVTVGAHLTPRSRRVCGACARNHHRHQMQRHGVHFPLDARRKLGLAAALLVAMLPALPL